MTQARAILEVPTVSCAHCEAAIKRAVGAIDGVAAVTVDLAAKTVSVDYEAEVVALAAVEQVMADEGYAVVGREVRGVHDGADCEACSG